MHAKVILLVVHYKLYFDSQSVTPCSSDISSVGVYTRDTKITTNLQA